MIAAKKVDANIRAVGNSIAHNGVVGSIIKVDAPLWAAENSIIGKNVTRRGDVEVDAILGAVGNSITGKNVVGGFIKVDTSVRAVGNSIVSKGVIGCVVKVDAKRAIKNSITCKEITWRAFKIDPVKIIASACVVYNGTVGGIYQHYAKAKTGKLKISNNCIGTVDKDYLTCVAVANSLIGYTIKINEWKTIDDVTKYHIIITIRNTQAARNEWIIGKRVLVRDIKVDAIFRAVGNNIAHNGVVGGIIKVDSSVWAVGNGIVSKGVVGDVVEVDAILGAIENIIFGKNATRGGRVEIDAIEAFENSITSKSVVGDVINVDTVDAAGNSIVSKRAVGDVVEVDAILGAIKNIIVFNSAVYYVV